MHKILITIFVLTTSIFSQTSNFIFDKISIDSIISIEKSLDSYQKLEVYQTFLSEDYYPSKQKYDLAQPIVFIKGEKSFISDCEAEYFFNPNDSIVRVILYTWDYSIEENKTGYVKGKYSEKERLNLYNDKFDSIFTQIIKIIDTPLHNEAPIIKMQKDNKVICNRIYEWSNKIYKITLSLLWVEQYKFYSNLRIRMAILFKE